MKVNGYLEKARSAEKVLDYNSAISFIKKYLMEKPNDLENRLYFCNLLIKNKEIGKAIILAKEVMRDAIQENNQELVQEAYNMAERKYLLKWEDFWVDGLDELGGKSKEEAESVLKKLRSDTEEFIQFAGEYFKYSKDSRIKYLVRIAIETHVIYHEIEKVIFKYGFVDENLFLYDKYITKYNIDYFNAELKGKTVTGLLDSISGKLSDYAYSLRNDTTEYVRILKEAARLKEIEIEQNRKLKPTTTKKGFNDALDDAVLAEMYYNIGIALHNTKQWQKSLNQFKKLKKRYPQYEPEKVRQWINRESLILN